MFLNNGTLKIGDGGSALTYTLSHIAYAPGSAATATVSGPNSKWEVDYTLFIGGEPGPGTTNFVGGDGVLSIKDQGMVQADYAVVVFEKSRIELEPGTAARLHIGASAPVSPSAHSQITIGPSEVGPNYFGILRLLGGTVQTEELN